MAARALGSALLGLVVATACASDLVAIDGGYRHRRHDYTIGLPDGPGPPWKKVSVEGAVIAYRRRGSETMALQSRCGRPVAAPAVMARHLVIGLDERTLRQAGPVVLEGLDGWVQVFDTRQDGVVVRVKTVTVVAGGCTFDWTLAAAGSFEDAESAFDAWWQTFHLDAESVAAGVPQ